MKVAGQGVEQKKEGNQEMTRDMKQQPRRILVIDDDLDVWKAYQLVLAPEAVSSGTSAEKINRLLSPGMENDPAAAHFSLSFAAQGQEGFAMVEEAARRKEPFALAFVDVRMPPGWDGMETAKRIRALDPEIELVIVTAYSDHSIEEIVRAVGSSEKLLFLRKPFDPDEIRQLALSLTTKWYLARLAEQQRKDLIASEHRFRSLVETTSDFVWEVDSEGRFSYCSPVSLDLYGYAPEELAGKIFFEVLAEPESRDQFRQVFFSRMASASRCHAVERRCLTKEGRLVIVESSGTPVFDAQGRICGYHGIDRDITARKENETQRQRLEERFRQTQKLEALGTLAGGIAHDLNNILTPILANSQLGKMQTVGNNELHAKFETIESCGRRAADLIRRILSFSRKQKIDVQPLDLRQLIQEFTKMLRRLIREDITLTVALPEKLWAVLVDRSQMEQVLMNLVVNARDAMDKGGELRISAENMSVAAYSLYDVDLREICGDFVVLAVSDQGCGIDANNMTMVFDPFFTTKEVGKGTGLGLATVHGIVAQHGGHIFVESEEGKGSTFKIFLPKSEGAVSGEKMKATPLHLEEGTESILLVEDDAEVLQILAATLEGLGYRVAAAANGKDALDIFAEKGEGIDMLVTDLIMPGLGGKALGRAIRDRRPDLPILYMTGYAFDVETQELEEERGSALLQKPFAMDHFARVVRKLLDSRS
ncbi:MAG: response regulator [Desulfurivibrio sp.]|nr:response regulator [Desulfurivibrio sp.]